jgi:hypothetical protein
MSKQVTLVSPRQALIEAREAWLAQREETLTQIKTRFDQRLLYLIEARADAMLDVLAA